jgi:hypothetical protein
MPDDFEYLGAFLTPEPDLWVDDAHTWEWGGQAMAFSPEVRGDRCSDLEFASQIPCIADPVPSPFVPSDNTCPILLFCPLPKI